MPRWPLTQVLRQPEPAPRAVSAGGPVQPGLLPLIFAFTLGALSILQLPALPDAQWLLLVAIPALLPWRYRWHAVAFLTGAMLSLWHAQAVLEQRWPIGRLGEEISARGTIASLPKATTDQADEDTSEDSPAKRTWRFVFEPDDPALPQQIRVAWYRSAELVRGGDCWTLQLRLRPPHGSLNPGGFDFEGWLFRQGIGATGTVRAAEPCGVANGHRVLRARQRLSERFAEWLPGHPGLPLVAALAIGDTSALDTEAWQNFRLTGTTHLIAISGFNVAIIAGVAFFLLRWLWSLSAGLCLRLPAQRAGLLGSALAALAYALLAGFDPPVERAAFMLLFVLGVGWFDGFAQASRALAVAWAIIIAVDPLALLTPGLWLSFGAVAAIFYVSSGRLEKRSAWREALRVQLMLSIVLAPMTLFWFQGTSLLGPVVNLVAVPIAAVLTPALLVALILAALIPAAGIPALRFIATVLDQSSQGLGWLAAHVPQAWVAASPEPAVVALALVGALLLFMPVGIPLRGLGALCMAGLLLPAASSPRHGFELTALDVGQGLAIVVRTSGHTLLFDAGPASPDGFDAGRAVVVPYLLKIGVRRLDTMMVSHSDLDHRGGVPAVRELISVDREMGALVPEACRPGDSWEWDGVRFEILNGHANGLSDNDGGCVLRIIGESLSALLPADIEAAGEARLLDTYSGDLSADILLAPHHGSRTSSGAEFIEAVQPRIVIHSAGWHHRFRHPSPEIVDRYEKLLPGVRQYSTASSGAVTVSGSRDALMVDRWRLSERRIWTVIDEEARVPP